MIANFHDQSVFGQDHFDLIFDEEKYLVVLERMMTIEEWNYKKVAIFITHQMIQRLFLENHSKLVTRGLPKR